MKQNENMRWNDTVQCIGLSNILVRIIKVLGSRCGCQIGMQVCLLGSLLRENKSRKVKRQEYAVFLACFSFALHKMKRTIIGKTS